MSKQRNFRGRSKLSFDEDEEDGSGVVVPAPKPPAKPKTAPSAAAVGGAAIPKRDSKPSLLSFEEDEQGGSGVRPPQPVRKEKKDAASKFKRAQGLPTLPAVAEPTTQQSAAGEYTAERLQELKANALSFSATKFGGDSASGRAQPPLIKLSGSFKPAGAPSAASGDFQGAGTAPDAQMGSGSSREPSPAAPSVPPRGAAPSPSPLGRPGTVASGAGQPVRGVAGVPGLQDVGEEEEEEEDDGGIPDEDTIRLAKAKRERLRQAHLAPDYIPLGGASKLLASVKGTTGGRGKAQEPMEVEVGSASGSEGEGDLEEHMRIKFSVAGQGRLEQRKGYSASLSTAADDDESAFADEQLRKAVRRSQAAMPSARGSAGTGAAQGREPSPAGMGGAGSAVMGAMAKSRMDAIMASGAAALAALRDGVARLTTSHKSAQSNLARTAAQLSDTNARISTLQDQSKAASEKYVYAQQFRTYVADLLDCLADKSALVEELEESLMELREERAVATQGERQVLEDELMHPAHAAVGAVLRVLGQGGTLPAAQQAATVAAAEAESELEDKAAGAAEVDEFGRSMDLGRRREAQARRRQRTELLAREAERLKAVSAGGPITLTVDAWQLETDAQVSRYVDRHAEIMSAGATVFADAGEEFASLEGVKGRLEDFKQRYPTEYASTYMSESCPALFAPYVRLELLRWDPLYADASRRSSPATDAAGAAGPAGAGLGFVAAGAGGTATNGAGERTANPTVHAGLDKQAWYNALFDYGMGSDPHVPLPPDDPDGELVPQLVRKLVLPLATHMLTKCWDPLSPTQTKAAVHLVEELLVYVQPDEPAMAELLECVCQGLGNAVKRVSMPAWPPVALAASPMAAGVLSLRFQAGLRLLRALGSWDSVLSRGLLQSIGLEQVLGQHMMPYLRAEASGVTADPHVAIARMEAVAQALPGTWFEGGCPPAARAFIELLQSTATALESQRDQKARLSSLAQRLAKALARVGEQQRASRLGGAFGVSH